jgi:hypothetical protein
MDHPTPTARDVVRAVVRGTRRQLGVAQKQKTAFEIDALCSVVVAIPNDLRLRDSAPLLVWLGGGHPPQRARCLGGTRPQLRGPPVTKLDSCEARYT